MVAFQNCGGLRTNNKKQQQQTLLFLKKLLVTQAIHPRLFSPTQKKAISQHSIHLMLFIN